MTARTDLDAAQAIARSISHTEIVTIEHDEQAQIDLTAECDDSVEHRRGNVLVREYWGTDEDGNEWRVHTHQRDAGT